MSVDASRAHRKLRALNVALRDWRPFWPVAMRIIRAWFGLQFESEGAFGGAKWAPLTPDYAAYKASQYPGKSILVATGKLKRAATAPTWHGRPTSLEIVIADAVAIYHQEGTSSMPARPIIPHEFPLSAHEELRIAAELYLTEAVRRLL